jgi:hypothetical protein
MGRHVNADAAVGDSTADPQAVQPPHETPRHAAPGTSAAGHILDDDAVISPNTHVGVDFDRLAPGTPDAAPSPANPDALVERGTVGDGHEME